MPDAIIIAQFERRLVELGCPSRPLAEKVRELAEHHEDLKQAAMEEGLKEVAADTRAAIQLGSPRLLAENAVRLLRESSWWGRHPVIGFGVLPLLSFLPALAGCCAAFAGLCWLLGQIFGPAYAMDAKLAGALSDDPQVFYSFAGPLTIATLLATIILLTFIFCRLASRSAVGWKWMLVACAGCALDSFSTYLMLQPHSVSLGFRWYPEQWYYPVIPLAAAAYLFAIQRWKESRLAWVPTAPRTENYQRMNHPARREFYRTPTYWVVTILVLACAVLIGKAMTDVSLANARRAGWKSQVWPAERAATLALLKERQSVPMAAGEETVDLKPWLNAALTDSTGTIKDNNLAELGVGLHTFNGVPFDVEGTLQLAGQPATGAGKKFPERINGILVGRKCNRLYVLHGAGPLVMPNRKIARLVLHYADGSKAEIGIVGGRDVLDWWGPIYQTGAGSGRNPTSPGTELAWAGSNPGIQKRSPDLCIRLFKSAFANPHPDLVVTSIDYASTLSGTAPFLAGLTTGQPSSQ